MSAKKRTKRPVTAKVTKEVEEPRRTKQTYGTARCLWCKKPFERTRPWSTYDKPYCRVMHWHTQNRRVSRPGQIVEVDGERLDKPVPAIDERLEEKMRAETEHWMHRDRGRGAK